jgi:FkbM family methyltransferase
MYEGNDYRTSLRRFAKASIQNPDILVDIALHDGATLFDVGAYMGEWTIRMLRRADDHAIPNIRIHAFEPLPGAVRGFEQAVDGDARAQLHPYGLSGQSRVETIAIGYEGSSVFDNPDISGKYGNRQVELRDVHEVLSTLKLDTIDGMIINIEGGEYELLDRLYETDWLPRIRTLLVQFHKFVPRAHASRRRNRRQLAATHDRAWNYEWVYERWDRRSQGPPSAPPDRATVAIPSS